MTKKLLVLMGGITDKKYILNELKSTEWDLTTYDHVCEFDSEKYRDKWRITGTWLNKISWFDKHGDWLKFGIDEGKRELIRDEFRKFLYLKKCHLNHNCEITVIAHSLGTWELLGADVKIDNCYLIGCPLGFNGKLVKYLANEEVKDRIESGKHLRVKNKLINLYSKNDFVGNEQISDNILLKVVNNDKKKIEIIETGTSHNFVEYITEYLKKL